MSCCCFPTWALITAFVTFLFFYISKKDGVRIAGVYAQPGKFYWIKVIVFYLLVKFRKWKDAREINKQKDHTNQTQYDAGYGTKSKSSPEEMDKVQKLSNSPQAIDAIYFNGANKNGFYIVTGTARRQHKTMNGFIIFRIPDVGTLVSPKFPDTMLFDSSEEYYGAEGFRYEVVEPMKEWKLSYEGDLKLYGDDTKTFKVSLKASWRTKLDFFDYDVMIPTWTMARAIAKETWSREYFQMLKDAHQTHYEQHGDLEGVITVNGNVHKFSMPSMRDHSYGFRRDWKLLHRYIFHMFSLEDGRRFDIGIVSQPVTSSDLELGYMYEADGSLHALSAVNPPLYFYGEGGSPPTDYGVLVRATNGKEYFVQVEALETQELYMGWEWEAKIIERRCKFTVDGVVGYGISECMYRNISGRPEKYLKTDPEFAKTLNKK